jgi:hypothetical protein
MRQTQGHPNSGDGKDRDQTDIDVEARKPEHWVVKVGRAGVIHYQPWVSESENTLAKKLKAAINM